MKKGKVKFYDKTRGFGFILRDDNEENVYFSIKDVEEGKQLKAGDRVQFEIEKTDKGIKAKNIKKL